MLITDDETVQPTVISYMTPTVWVHVIRHNADSVGRPLMSTFFISHLIKK